MIIIGNNEVKRFIHNNRDLLALVQNGRIIWGSYIIIIPSELEFMFVGEEKTYNVMSVGHWEVEELFASDASRSLIE